MTEDTVTGYGTPVVTRIPETGYDENGVRGSARYQITNTAETMSISVQKQWVNGDAEDLTV